MFVFFLKFAPRFIGSEMSNYTTSKTGCVKLVKSIPSREGQKANRKIENWQLINTGLEALHSKRETEKRKIRGGRTVRLIFSYNVRSITA